MAGLPWNLSNVLIKVLISNYIYSQPEHLSSVDLFQEEIILITVLGLIKAEQTNIMSARLLL